MSGPPSNCQFLSAYVHWKKKTILTTSGPASTQWKTYICETGRAPEWRIVGREGGRRTAAAESNNRYLEPKPAMWEFLTAFSSCSIHRESSMRGGFRGPLAPPFRREISSANFWGELGRGDSGLKSFFTPAIFEFFFTGNANLLVSFLSAPPSPPCRV